MQRGFLLLQKMVIAFLLYVVLVYERFLKPGKRVFTIWPFTEKVRQLQVLLIIFFLNWRRITCIIFFFSMVILSRRWECWRMGNLTLLTVALQLLCFGRRRSAEGRGTNFLKDMLDIWINEEEEKLKP